MSRKKGTGEQDAIAARPVESLTVPARVRLLDAQAAGLLDEGQAGGMPADAFVFTAEISSTTLDAYYTHMADSTLRNFARDVGTGVALLDSHDGYKLGVGYSAGGRYEEENGEGRALGVFYIVSGLRYGGKHSFAASDDYIRAIQTGVVRDVSVGFYGGRWICDLCKQPYFGQGSACQHFAGYEYEIERDGVIGRELCTVTIHDARLSEVSLVYDGATPGAMILKAEQEAEAGRLTPVMIRQLEQQYRVALPHPPAAIATGRAADAARLVVEYGGGATTDAIGVTIQQYGGRATAAQPAVRGQGETMDEELVVVGIEVEEPATLVAPGGDEGDSDVAEAERTLAAIRDVTARSAAPQGISLEAAVRWLNEQLVEATRQRDEAQQEVARLQPLADQGRAYRDELVNQAVAEGVRAMGEAFPEETYRAMLAGAPLEHIRQVRDTFADQARVRFPGGRQTRDVMEGDGQPIRPTTPAAAYGAH